MTAYPIDIPSTPPFPETEIAAYCRDPCRRKPRIDGPTQLALLNPDLVVKFGCGVYEEEFHNQAFAHRLLDPSIVHVPRPVHFFYDRLGGFLVVEWVSLTSVTSADVDAVALAVQHMHSVTAPELADPGPVDGGLCRGDRFHGEPYFESKDDLEMFLNDRYGGHPRSPVTGAPFLLDDKQPLVFCHLDLAARNLGRTADGIVCMVDWAMAGFFPRWFDHGMMEACRDGKPSWHEVNMFKKKLTQAMERLAPLTHAERDMKNALVQVVDNCWSLHFHDWNDPSPSPSPPPKKRKKMNGSSASIFADMQDTPEWPAVPEWPAMPGWPAMPEWPPMPEGPAMPEWPVMPAWLPPLDLPPFCTLPLETFESDSSPREWYTVRMGRTCCFLFEY